MILIGYSFTVGRRNYRILWHIYRISWSDEPMWCEGEVRCMRNLCRFLFVKRGEQRAERHKIRLGLHRVWVNWKFSQIRRGKLIRTRNWLKIWMKNERKVNEKWMKGLLVLSYIDEAYRGCLYESVFKWFLIVMHEWKLNNNVSRAIIYSKYLLCFSLNENR